MDRKQISRALVVLAGVAVGQASSVAATLGGGNDPSATGPPSLVLLTLDTTRADRLGSYGGAAATPVLDSLAATGVRYARALTPSPLTMPAHASLMTGLEPPEHGVRDNGTAALGPKVPTLAAALAERGFDTAAFVSSRVLDRRFGLARGFDSYDDLMTAEMIGEYGYAERNARAVTSAAIAWLAAVSPERPFFLWVHYYDPHAPYAAPGAQPAASSGRRYVGEIQFMDSEIGRLLRALPLQPRGRIIAVVGDHGEALGEHGERSHGVFLYGASLEVPLIIAGSGVPRGRVVGSAVGTRRLPATLLALLEPSLDTALPGPTLPGLSESQVEGAQPVVYSESHHTATAYGWAPLRAVTDDRWRLIEAPRVELYDLEADPGETHNLAAEARPEARRLVDELRHLDKTMTRGRAARVQPDPALSATLRSLGYAGSNSDAGKIDPKDGIGWLHEAEEARALGARGDHRRAVLILEDLVRRNPRNVPFLTQLAAEQVASGEAESGIATYRRALSLNPELEFLYLHLADAYRRAGRTTEARTAYETALRLDPRSVKAWLALAEAANTAGRTDEERQLLERAVEAGTTSGTVHYRLGQIALRDGELDSAERNLRRATELIPGWVSPWLARGEAAARSGRYDQAVISYERATRIDPSSAVALLGLARVHEAQGEPAAARVLLERLIALAPGSVEAGEARSMLTAGGGRR